MCKLKLPFWQFQFSCFAETISLCNNLALRHAAKFSFQGELVMAESVMLNKAKDFAVEIVFLCKRIKAEKKESVLTNQLLRAGTSIGANIHESKYANSIADFIYKMQLALKECYEAEYWLELLHRTEHLTDEEYQAVGNRCGQIRRMLISSINTVKKNES